LRAWSIATGAIGNKVDNPIIDIKSLRGSPMFYANLTSKCDILFGEEGEDAHGCTFLDVQSRKETPVCITRTSPGANATRLNSCCKRNCSVSCIARKLHVHRSTIYRELRRGGHSRQGYRGWYAQEAVSGELAAQQPTIQSSPRHFGNGYASI